MLTHITEVCGKYLPGVPRNLHSLFFGYFVRWNDVPTRNITTSGLCFCFGEMLEHGRFITSNGLSEIQYKDYQQRTGHSRIDQSPP